MAAIFISHSTQDDDFVRELQAAMADHGQLGWIDSRELRGGDLLWPEIQRAIEAASAYMVVVSPDGLQSKWVGKELMYALKLQQQRGKHKFPVIPLSLNGTKLGVLEEFFGEEPAYISVSSAAGGIAAAMNLILVALGKRLNADVAATPQPPAQPLEELVLHLSDLKFHEQDGVRRASARARLSYESTTDGKNRVASHQPWRFIAPLSPIETEKLRWYLEKYAIWPSHHFRSRAQEVEANLLKWGQLLHESAMPAAQREEVMKEWQQTHTQAGRRFSVLVDAEPEAGAPEDEVRTAKEVATLLLGLPWELLHDGQSYLFQGAKPTRVRRTLLNTKAMEVAVVATPIRILLVTARPEDAACGYIDHRASALPLVEAMEALPGLVKLHILSPATLPALSAELERARSQQQPYHVVHFDGHGVYDAQVGLGGLCFELPEDSAKLEQRRHATIYTDQLGPLLRDYRIPLVFLEACQSAQAEQASDSVASELLKVGVASVVAMSHNVLVETSKRFVTTFYQALAAGKRVGDAMLAGQRALKDDNFRGHIFSAGELRLEDWFVPVLFQEKDDPQLFKYTPSKQTVADSKTALVMRLGQLPPAPQTGFIGRSRELLALQRLLRPEGKARYAVIRGQGGEGKTALAAEFARWMVRSQQIQRAVFVSVETHHHPAALLDAIGSQLVPNYSVATFADWQQALLPITRALTEQTTLLLVDNMESILLPPYISNAAALTAENQRELSEILQLCAQLNAIGDTRLVFTSRETLPAPFDAHCRELRQLQRDDAVKLIERVLNSAEDGSDARDAAREQIEQLVDAVHAHARTLTLLAPALRAQGVVATRLSLHQLMAQMQQQVAHLPDHAPQRRELSLFASVELSLRRMSAENRERVTVLGVFQGGVQLGVLHHMMQWQEDELAALAAELIQIGLATPNRYNHLTLNPALCPYLRGGLGYDECEALTARWLEAMGAYVEFLVQQSDQNAQLAATLTQQELANLFALLEQVQRAGNAEATIDLCSSLYRLLQNLGKPRLLVQVGQVRDAAAQQLEKTQGETWSHARFQAARTRIEQKWASGRLHEALAGAQALLRRARAVGEQDYADADYDLAMACWLLARVLKTAGAAQQALPLLDEARQRFEAFAQEQPNRGAERMASVCFSEQGECLLDLGRLDEAGAAYEESVRRAAQRGDDRDVAVGKGQLGTVRLYQRRYPEALLAYAAARELFSQLGELGSVATSWHQTGMTYQDADQPQAAEDAYRQALAIKVQLGNQAGQASTLGQLGNLYDNELNRPEEAVAFYSQAADIYVACHDAAKEGVIRNNLGETLRKLQRIDQARQQIERAIDCKAQFGHAAEPWKAWAILADIETDAGNASTAATAKAKAVAAYLAYRRDGGENHYNDGRLCLAVTQLLQAGDSAQAVSLLQQLAADPEAAHLHAFIHALLAIVAGSRESSLADAPELHYTMAAEILWLIEVLQEQAG